MIRVCAVFNAIVGGLGILYGLGVVALANGLAGGRESWGEFLLLVAGFTPVVLAGSAGLASTINWWNSSSADSEIDLRWLLAAFVLLLVQVGIGAVFLASTSSSTKFDWEEFVLFLGGPFIALVLLGGEIRLLRSRRIANDS